MLARTSPKERLNLCGVVATAIRANSSHSVISEVAKTFRLASHKAWSRASSSQSDDDFKGVKKTVGFWIRKCVSTDTQSLLKETALFCLHFQQKIVITATNLLLKECHDLLTPELILTALYVELFDSFS